MNLFPVLAAVTMVANAIEIAQDMGPQSPVNFRKIGTIHYSGRTYLLPLLLNINDLFKMTEPLVDGLNNCQDKYDSLVKKTNGETGSYRQHKGIFPVLYAKPYHPFAE